MPTPQAGSIGALTDGVSQTLSGSFSLAQIKDFPYSDWGMLTERYNQEVDWYSGSVLDETLQADGKQSAIEKYPVHVNPIPAICAKHNFALFGDLIDDTRPLVYPKFYPALQIDTDEGLTDDQKKLVKEAEEVMSFFWWENSGRAVQWRAGLLSQIFGGFVFMLRWTPDDITRAIPLKVELVDPRHFIGFPIPGEEYRLQEMWITKPIDWKTAEYYGYPEIVQGMAYYWVEHWTEKTYEITINDKPVKWPDDESRSSSGNNEWGFIPAIYIPHTRAANFYGQNAFDEIVGLIKEYNLRLADYGDAVSVDSHNVGSVSDVQGQIRVIKPIEGLTLLDLGNTASITGSEQSPKIELLKTSSASSPMKDLVIELYKQIRRDAYIPAVADGEDEGSQRSGETLVARMWPLISHTRGERVCWSSGLDIFTRMVMSILAKKKIAGITTAHVKGLKCRQIWAPQLPKDRESTVNEAVNRMTTNLGSPELLLGMLGDSEDVEETIEQMKEWIEFIEETKAEASAKVAAARAPAASTGGVAPKGKPNPSGSNAKEDND